MQIKIVTLEDVHYNPAANTFEALVNIRTPEGEFSYPCAIEGALAMPLQTAAFKLTQQAKQRHKAGDCLHARRVDRIIAGLSAVFSTRQPQFPAAA